MADGTYLDQVTALQLIVQKVSGQGSLPEDCNGKHLQQTLRASHTDKANHTPASLEKAPHYISVRENFIFSQKTKPETVSS